MHLASFPSQLKTLLLLEFAVVPASLALPNLTNRK